MILKHGASPKKLLQFAGFEMQVTYFQRKPRSNGNFSIEQVFEGVRRELAEQVDARVCVAPFCSDGFARRVCIAWHARRHQGDINHVTGDTNFTALALDPKRTILTNHDCGFAERTTGFRRWLLLLFWLKLPARRVAAVTTVSAQIKQEIIRHTGCSPDKVHVIPNAVPGEFKPVPKSFSVQEPRILHIGTAANKNLPRLIEAVAGLSCTLVIIGAIENDVRRQLEETQVQYEKHIDLSTAEIVRQYELCDLVSFASLYEGFGVPILEAQAVGRPLLTSDRPPMSDVARDGAMLVDPTDPNSIRAGIDRIISDAAYRSQLIERGFENIKRFQPECIAQQYLHLYEQVFAEANYPSTDHPKSPTTLNKQP